MSQIIDNRTNLDQTVRIFDSFYAFNSVVNAVEYDIVYSYFVSVCASKNIAANFTAVLFRIAQETQISVLQLIDQLKGTQKMEMNQILAYYLNSYLKKFKIIWIRSQTFDLGDSS